MNYIHLLRKLFFYGGVEKEEYEQLLPSIREENRILLKVFSSLGAVMFFLLFIVSMLSDGFVTVNRVTYLVNAIGMVIILLCYHYILPQHPALVMVFVYIFELMLHMFGIHISMLHTEKAAVSAVALLLVTPLLFYDRPIRLTALLAASVTLFCVLAVRIKEPDVSDSDVWNMITFGIVAVSTTVFWMRIKIHSLAQSRQNEYLSQTDLLTGTKNRNHFENQLQSYAHLFTSTLICVYADVNGLHEMNNKKGHAAGDRMLREVAAQMQKCFGKEHTYRIGGDEFTAFRIDAKVEEVTAEVELLKQRLEQEGYHVSFGIALREKAQGSFNVYELVNEAERTMFAAKREFYRQTKNDRRSR